MKCCPKCGTVTLQLRGATESIHRLDHCRDALLARLAEMTPIFLQALANATRVEQLKAQLAHEHKQRIGWESVAVGYRAELDTERDAWKAQTREHIRQYMEKDPDLRCRKLSDLNGVIEAEHDLTKTELAAERARSAALQAAVERMREALEEAERIGVHVENCNSPDILGQPTCPACVESGRQLHVLAKAALSQSPTGKKT
jgi:sugar phosphate isomerase/epimerase